MPTTPSTTAAPPPGPFDGNAPRDATATFTRAEVALANRNSGLPLEFLRHDVTPPGAHYLLTHFDVPDLPAADHVLRLTGAFEMPLTLTLADLAACPQVTRRVTMECAGNGRSGMDPRPLSMPWGQEAVGTADWTGTPLAPLLARARPRPDVADFAFLGADRGFDRGVPHHFGRSLTPAEVDELDALIVWAMNGGPLAPQHGAPLRLIVPGWYGMASVKWLTDIVALDHRYDGFQQVQTYRIRHHPEDAGSPVQRMRVRALMQPPGVPDWYSRARWLEPGPVRLSGRAWSGGGVPVSRVEVLLDGQWRDADLTPPADRYAWTGWTIDWQARTGIHDLACRATDAEGHVQPLVAGHNLGGFCNNAVQRLRVQVGPGPAG